MMCLLLLLLLLSGDVMDVDDFWEERTAALPPTSKVGNATPTWANKIDILQPCYSTCVTPGSFPNSEARPAKKPRTSSSCVSPSTAAAAAAATPFPSPYSPINAQTAIHLNESEIQNRTDQHVCLPLYTGNAPTCLHIKKLTPTKPVPQAMTTHIPILRQQHTKNTIYKFIAPFSIHKKQIQTYQHMYVCPCTQVIRLHAFTIKKLTPTPLPKPLPQAMTTHLPMLRQRAIQLLSAPLAGDELAAEYLLLTAIGSVSALI